MKSIIIPLVIGFVIITPIKIKGENKCPQVEFDPPIDILLPHEYHCTRFYKCSMGKAHEEDCPNDLYFNPERNICDWPFNVNCTNEDSSEDSEENNKCPPMGKDPEDDILFPHDTDCSKFLKCSHGNVFEMDCPKGLYFNSVKNECDWPNNVNCTSGTPGGDSGSEDSSSEEISNERDTCPSVEEDPKHDVLLAHESDCSKFYKCSHGEKFEMSCGDGLHFNPNNKKCDWPKNVNCTHANDTIHSSNNNKNSCSSGDGFLLPHDSDCSKFYQCSHGKRIESNCPLNLHFNPDKKYCDYPKNVNCPN